MNTSLPKAGLLALIACAALAAPADAQAPGPPSGVATTAEAPVVAPARAKRNRNLITIEEIRESNATSAYDVVSRLRAGWLRKRGTSSLNREGTILVYRDGMRIGAPGVLRQINATDLESIAYLDGMEATQRFGIDHGNGAIIVTTRR